MAATIIHFGVDLAARVPVLENAGFQVDTCSSLDSLIEVLERKHVDAVLVPERPEVNVEGVVNVTHSSPSTHTILFADAPGQPYDATFDLVIPILTPPQKWLADLGELIAQSKAVRVESQYLHVQASTLREESRDVRQRTAEERARARELRRTFPKPANTTE